MNGSLEHPSDNTAENFSVDPDEDTTAMHIIVYEGFFVQLITNKLNLSVPYYTKIRAHLIRMGCIRQLKRGGGSGTSQWELIYEPTLEAFMKAVPTKVPKQGKDAALLEMIDNLSGRIAELEEWQAGVNEALANLFGTEPAPDGNQ